MTPRAIREHLLRWTDSHPWQSVAAAGTSLALWCAGTGAVAQVAASPEVLRLAVVDLAWLPQCATTPWLLALCGAAPAWLRWLSSPGRAPGAL